MEENVIQTFLDLASISSPSRNERAVADYVIKRISKYGLKIEEDHTGEIISGNSGNLIVKIPGVGTPILFDSHMDTVSPCENVNPSIKNGRITSDSNSILGADDKVGIATMLCLIDIIMLEKIAHPSITFIFSVCEEESLLGAKNLSSSFLEDICYAYVLDGEGEIGTVTNKTPFGCKGTITIAGKEAHAGVNPEKGINALVVASEVITKLKIGRINRNTTCNIGKISGGTASNVVMGNVEMAFEARSFDIDELKELIHHVKEVCLLTCNKHKATCRLDLKYGTPGYQIDENEEILFSMKKICDRENFKYSACSCGGGSNANIYHMKNIPAVCLGTNMKNVHSVEEFIEIADIKNLLKLILGITQYMAK